MGPIRQQLLDMILRDDRYDLPAAELDPLRLEAARELFAERREQIPVLRKRTEESGVTEIRSFHDLVPLLFAHTVYKSYPQNLVDQGKWQALGRWLRTLSVEDPTQVDVSGVRNVDEWIDTMRAHGHLLLATSGSSGKVSFLNSTRGDLEMKKRHWQRTLGWPYLTPNKDRVVFNLGPSEGPNSAIEASRIGAELWGKPGSIHFLTDEPLKISEVSAMAALRKRMQDGTATPQEIADMEKRGAEQGARMMEALNKLVDTILAHRDQPIILTGMWAQHMAIIRRARELSIPDGAWHPQSYISSGGGVKGVALPPDYVEQVDRFWGKVIRGTGYGMTEMLQLFPRCEKRRYHCPPGLIMLHLDQPGEKLIAPAVGTAGVVEGRFGFLDLMYEGRWGGLISGDKVQIDYSGRCECGRHGPTILDTIVRYTQVTGQDDHIGCAGTIDAYVRGAMA